VVLVVEVQVDLADSVVDDLDEVEPVVPGNSYK
jgi:hypothetical protein